MTYRSRCVGRNREKARGRARRALAAFRAMFLDAARGTFSARAEDADPTFTYRIVERLPSVYPELVYRFDGDFDAPKVEQYPMPPPRFAPLKLRANVLYGPEDTIAAIEADIRAMRDAIRAQDHAPESAVLVREDGTIEGYGPALAGVLDAIARRDCTMCGSAPGFCPKHDQE